jgi:hypothetical protein
MSLIKWQTVYQVDRDISNDQSRGENSSNNMNRRVYDKNRRAQTDSLRLRKNFRIGCLLGDRKTASYGQNKNNTFLVHSDGIVERFNRTLEAT